MVDRQNSPAATGPSITPVIDAVAFDATDPMGLAKFWQSLLGGVLRRDKHGDVELHGGPVRLDFLRVPEGKEVKNRLHLDLYIPPGSRIEMIKRAVQLGATRAADLYDGGRWQVMRDIEGNEFCFVWGTG
jgi:hypothetical protein